MKALVKDLFQFDNYDRYDLGINPEMYWLINQIIDVEPDITSRNQYEMTKCHPLSPSQCWHFHKDWIQLEGEPYDKSKVS